MTDDVAPEPVEEPGQPGQSGERARRSRRRGKRSKNKGTEVQASTPQAAPETDRQPAKPAPPSSGQPKSSRKAPPLKTGYLPFNDGLDRFVCPACLRFLPQEFPVQHRRGTASIPLREVDRREGELLLCNGLHGGPCLWPDGVVVGGVVPDAAPGNESPNGHTSEQAVDVISPDTQDAAVDAPPDETAAARPAPENAPKVMRLTGSR